MSNAATTSRAYTNRTQSLKNKQAVIDMIATGNPATIEGVLAKVGIPVRTYQYWRYSDKHFLAKVEAAKCEREIAYGGQVRRKMGDKTFDFAQERLHFFGNDSPWFHLEVVRAMETLGPGNILMVLFPPSHGKTTLYEDWATLRLAHDPSLRNHIGSETITLSMKILSRIQDRLANPLAKPKLTELTVKYGPFAPPRDDQRRRGQPWTKKYFDVWRKGEFDERDYSLAALGFGSQIIGSRSDHLHVDDVQSMKTLGQTESMVEEFVQDWLSRPGRSGITTIVGNRIDEGDFYEALIERLDDDILQVIRYPAIVERGGDAEPLWVKTCPDPCPRHDKGKCPGFTMEELDKEHRKHGDSIWERNWMQRPRAKLFSTFDERTVEGAFNPMRRLGDIVAGKAHVIGLDPAIGGRKTTTGGRNAMVTCQFDETGLTPVLIREDRTLRNNQEILAVLEDQICTVRAGGGFVSDVVIEENAFQKGLCNDLQLEGLRQQYGFAVRPHTTGSNKYDENIGVPSMVHTFLRKQVHLPWADDDFTRLWVGELRAQFLAWKPLIKGTHLRQDLLMAFWYVWTLWRHRRGTVMSEGVQSWKTERRLPFAPTNALVLPRGVVPSVLGGR